MTTKLVRVIKNKFYQDYTPQDLIQHEKNKFKFWKCSAGSEGIFIDWEGTVYPATCFAGNKQFKLGSINDQNEIKLLDGYVDCNFQYCPCLVEIYLPKYKVTPHEVISEGVVDLSDFDAIDRASEHDKDRRYIMWAFGRKCNFSCSYCDDVSHSKDDKDLVSKDAIDKVYDYTNKFRKNKPIMWSFTGGEPTINPLFLDFVRSLKAKGDTITVATNGSQSSKYYVELANYANINISVHFEFLKPEKLRRVVESIINNKVDWFGLNFMIMPDQINKCIEYIDLLKNIPNFKEKVHTNFDILRVKNTGDYETYSDQERKTIQILQNKNYD